MSHHHFCRTFVQLKITTFLFLLCWKFTIDDLAHLCIQNISEIITFREQTLLVGFKICNCNLTPIKKQETLVNCSVSALIAHAFWLYLIYMWLCLQFGFLPNKNPKWLLVLRFAISYSLRQHLQNVHIISLLHQIYTIEYSIHFFHEKIVKMSFSPCFETKYKQDFLFKRHLTSQIHFYLILFK